MKSNLFIPIFLFSVLFIACSGGGGEDNGGGGPVDPPPTPTPTKATLSSPANNSECLEVDAVNFSWNASENTTSYTLTIKNLLTNQISTTTTTATSAEVTLTKGYPYSWQITSSNSSNTTAKSDKWKFYLSGEALTNYAPFPAELLTPAPDASVEKGNIELTWSVSDIDEDDSHKFDIYLDQTDASTRIFSNHSTRSKAITLSATGKYYWRIVTIDNHGSNSDSGISSFTVTD